LAYGYSQERNDALRKKRVDRGGFRMLNKEELAEKFIQAGHGKVEIAESDLEVLGIKMQKSFKSRRGIIMKISNWERFCIFVYEKVSGKPHPGSQLRGRGFRAQDFGRSVAKIIRDSIEEKE